MMEFWKVSHPHLSTRGVACKNGHHACLVVWTQTELTEIHTSTHFYIQKFQGMFHGKFHGTFQARFMAFCGRAPGFLRACARLFADVRPAFCGRASGFLRTCVRLFAGVRPAFCGRASAATPSLEENLAEKIAENNQCFGAFYTRAGAGDNTLALGDSKHSFAAKNWFFGGKLASRRKLTSPRNKLTLWRFTQN